LDANWRVANDGHPDVRAAHAIAVAIANQLRSAGVSPGNESFNKAAKGIYLSFRTERRAPENSKGKANLVRGN
jgi:hypothetical protein